jgi:TonB-dependent SusC/RagA subfamily outer membrane receptor
MKTGIIALAMALIIAPAAATQEPLCIIDGVIVSDCSRAGTLDPSRIESIEILKGQAAAARYGNRAAGGVIMIATKGGRGPEALTQPDPLAKDLFPPELVMANQQAIELTDSQRSAIQGAMREAQSRFVDLQFAVSGEMEKLGQLLGQTRVDEAAVLAQVDRVLAAEREIKRAQLGLMIRIKNQLTAEQQAELRALRR